jgi:hypothetical protein
MTVVDVQMTVAAAETLNAVSAREKAVVGTQSAVFASLKAVAVDLNPKNAAIMINLRKKSN